MSPRGWLAAGAAIALIAVGCGDDHDPPAQEREPAKTQPRHAEKQQALPPRLHCRDDAANCKSARGTIIYVEAVDPDGDGDAHFVLRSSEGVTFPGISVIDVENSLRPQPLPGVGDAVSAVGPVYRGSHGQRQIQAERLRVRRR
jgi:hypothetical protein